MQFAVLGAKDHRGSLVLMLKAPAEAERPDAFRPFRPIR